jgi:hypothetical protein
MDGSSLGFIIPSNGDSHHDLCEFSSVPGGQGGPLNGGSEQEAGSIAVSKARLLGGDVNAMTFEAESINDIRIQKPGSCER